MLAAQTEAAAPTLLVVDGSVMRRRLDDVHDRAGALPRRRSFPRSPVTIEGCVSIEEVGVLLKPAFDRACCQCAATRSVRQADIHLALSERIDPIDRRMIHAAGSIAMVACFSTRLRAARSARA